MSEQRLVLYSSHSNQDNLDCFFQLGQRSRSPFSADPQYLLFTAEIQPNNASLKIRRKEGGGGDGEGEGERRKEGERMRTHIYNPKENC